MSEQISTELNEYVDKYLVNEVQTEKERVDVAKEEAHSNVGKTHPVLGKCIATIPAREYFRLVQQYGTEEVHSKEFLKFFQKEMPELAPNKI
jgi:hypothetical protein